MPLHAKPALLLCSLRDRPAPLPHPRRPPPQSPGAGAFALPIEEGRGAIPARGLCGRSFALDVSYSNAAGATEWAPYSGGELLVMPPCSGAPTEPPAFASVSLTAGTLSVELQPLSAAGMGAGGGQLSYHVRGLLADTGAPAFEAAWTPSYWDPSGKVCLLLPPGGDEAGCKCWACMGLSQCHGLLWRLHTAAVPP